MGRSDIATHASTTPHSFHEIAHVKSRGGNIDALNNLAAWRARVISVNRRWVWIEGCNLLRGTSGPPSHVIDLRCQGDGAVLEVAAVERTGQTPDNKDVLVGGEVCTTYANTRVRDDASPRRPWPPGSRLSLQDSWAQASQLRLVLAKFEPYVGPHYPI